MKRAGWYFFTEQLYCNLLSFQLETYKIIYRYSLLRSVNFVHPHFINTPVYLSLRYILRRKIAGLKGMCIRVVMFHRYAGVSVG